MGELVTARSQISKLEVEMELLHAKSKKARMEADEDVEKVQQLLKVM